MQLIPYDQLVDAYFNGNSSLIFYYNAYTKEVFSPFENEVIELAPPIHQVPSISSKDYYALMVEFSHSLPEEDETQFFEALNGKKPIRHFLKLVSSSTHLNTWNEHRKGYALQQLSNWLSTIQQ